MELSSVGWDSYWDTLTLPRVLLGLSIWTLFSLLTAYYAVTRLGAVQAVLALVAQRAIQRVEAADGPTISGSGGSAAAKATCWRTPTGELATEMRTRLLGAIVRNATETISATRCRHQGGRPASGHRAACRGAAVAHVLHGAGGIGGGDAAGPAHLAGPPGAACAWRPAGPAAAQHAGGRTTDSLGNGICMHLHAGSQRYALPGTLCLRAPGTMCS
jgi:hypothetical protein